MNNILYKPRQESLDSLDYVLTLPLSIHDVSAVFYNKAETLFMMGRLLEAVTLYRCLVSDITLLIPFLFLPFRMT